MSTLFVLRNIQRRIVMQISLLVCNIYIYISIDTKDRYDEKSVLLRNTYDIPPQEHTAMTTTVHISQIAAPTR